MIDKEPTLTLSTIIEVSKLIGFQFGRNSTIRNAQNKQLVLELQEQTSATLAQNNIKDYFFGTLDFLIYEDKGHKKFKFLEFSGTGSGGTSNISYFAFNSILKEFTNISRYVKTDMPIILLGYTDSQSLSNSIPRKFIYERFFYAQSMKESFARNDMLATIITLPELIEKKSLQPSGPTIVIGFIKDFMKYLSCSDGVLSLFQQPISAILNDTLCNNVFKTYENSLNPLTLYTMNSIYKLSADKSLAYQLFNEYLKKNNIGYIDPINYSKAFNREDLINQILKEVSLGNKIVIKPYAGSVGMGVDFFIKNESTEEIICKVDEAIKTSETFQGINNWSFPFTISEYIDYLSIPDKEHQLYDHKYELRIIVYRDKNQLKAFPSVVRVAGKRYAPDNIERLMLLSYASLGDSKINMPKYKFLMPLSNLQTLDTLDLNLNLLEEMCAFSTNFLRYCIQELTLIE